MPLYDYQCDQCGHRFEVRQSIKEDPLTHCPECGGAIRRVIHPVGIVFKGSGFYITDSRNKSSHTSPAASDGASGEKSEKGEKKEASGGAESKPAASAAPGNSSGSSSTGSGAAAAAAPSAGS